MYIFFTKACYETKDNHGVYQAPLAYLPNANKIHSWRKHMVWISHQADQDQKARRDVQDAGDEHHLSYSQIFSLMQQRIDFQIENNPLE